MHIQTQLSDLFQSTSSTMLGNQHPEPEQLSAPSAVKASLPPKATEDDSQETKVSSSESVSSGMADTSESLSGDTIHSNENVNEITMSEQQPEPYEYVPCTLEEIQGKWETAFVLAYCYYFREWMGTLEGWVLGEEFEKSLISPSPSILLETLIINFLRNLPNARKSSITSTTYFKQLRLTIDKHIAQSDFFSNTNPCRSVSNFFELSPLDRLSILKSLVEWQISDNEKIRSFIDDSYGFSRRPKRVIDVNTILIRPLGKDMTGKVYWHLGDERVYGDFVDEKGEMCWEIVASGREEVESLIEELESVQPAFESLPGSAKKPSRGNKKVEQVSIVEKLKGRTTQQRDHSRLIKKLRSDVMAFLDAEEAKRTKAARQRRKLESHKPTPSLLVSGPRASRRKVSYTYNYTFDDDFEEGDDEFVGLGDGDESSDGGFESDESEEERVGTRRSERRAGIAREERVGSTRRSARQRGGSEESEGRGGRALRSRRGSYGDEEEESEESIHDSEDNEEEEEEEVDVEGSSKDEEEDEEIEDAEESVSTSPVVRRPTTAVKRRIIDDDDEEDEDMDNEYSGSTSLSKRVKPSSPIRDSSDDEEDY